MGKDMLPVKQTIVSSIDGKVRGNCLRAALASLLEISNIDAIPPFEQMSDATWFRNFYDWLTSVGYEFYGTQGPDGKREFEFEGIDGYYIATGKSPREHVKNGHAVVYHRGKFVHDPHESNAGILTFENFYLIKRRSL